jgi:rare lipoprotein A
MKNTLKYVSFVLVLALICSFSIHSTKHLDRKGVVLDTIKKKDTLGGLDSIKKITVTKPEDSVANLNTKIFKKNAHASYYHDSFTGRKTASGKIFDNKKMTAAHRSLKFGTKIKVTSVATNKSVIVTITDRGPFTKGRDIDLSKAAFRQICPNKYGGHIKVDIEIISD